MNATLKIVTAAAAVVVVGVIGLNLLPGSAQPGVGAAPTAAPTATAAPSLAPSASPIPLLPTSGRARARPVPDPGNPVPAARA